MEIVRKGPLGNLEEYEALTKLKWRLNISKTNPKKFTFGTILQDASFFVDD